jgi:hypothetical protein
MVLTPMLYWFKVCLQKEVRNMKNPYTIAALCLIGIAFFLKSGIANALLLFLLVGAIPGTSYNVPAVMMLFLVLAFTWFIFFRFTIFDTFQIRTPKHTSKHSAEHKKRMPRKRFEQI